MGPPFDSLAALRQISSNAQTRNAWQRCSAHRQRIQELIFAASEERGGRICVLGAGNCNDVDLRLLARRFTEIHLADIDRDALEAAVARQHLSGDPRIVLHAPCDVSGILGIGQYAEDRPDVDDLVRRIRAHSEELDGPYDLVLSAGLLTQMYQAAEDLGLPQPATLNLVLELRRQHLRLLFHLVRPGGAFIVATDVVSTASAPELRNCEEDELPAKLARLIEERNFFTGANPAAIWKEITEDAELSEGASAIESHDPWLWPVTASHDYLTWAMTVRTRDVINP
jgi:hypothetical protein